MKVFKFGGASVKDADGVKNLIKVLNETGSENKLIVISAMGKTTNALEVVVRDYLETTKIPKSLDEVKNYHRAILEELFPNKEAQVYFKVETLFTELENFLQHNKSHQYDFVYDQIVSFGELISTTIVSEYLNSQNIASNWLDARNYIKTDSTYRDAQVNWTKTQELIQKDIDADKLNIIQGFIGSDPNNFTTTLGREGSDYSAAIMAYCLNAENVTIWKDVPGVLNADPRFFEKAQLLNHISYEEAIELAFYGASVIHPKTLQPLQRKEIPLFVRSFINPSEEGTAVSKGKSIFPEIPCFIVKKNQVLISLSSLDFSFMVEENISEIFRLFHQYQMKVDLIQNSAISFRVCVDNKFNQLEKLIQHLKARFKVDYKTGVSLYTIRHFNEEAINSLEKDKNVLLKQLTQNTVQLVAEN
ncbi:aspartate kinase [Christiangramia sp. SM2212]|uniref:Aspartokinase n=1 Tax=Christiangramia sediminicola TaxID=3073267 RepID=A0ABU1ELR0_9FLAO|nr:aspartate kinase [Christiangramia sp. SM2212]MDR5589118.1 aspartate kinase [Christiangramia sp. SM2212]